MSDRIVARVRKLLRLSKSPEPHEAARASEEAARLMAAHGLTEEDVSEDVDIVVEPVADLYREEIAIAVALLFKCKAMSRGAELAFRGYRERVQDARDVYRALVSYGQSKSEVPSECYIDLVQGRVPPPVSWELANKAWASFYWPGFVQSVVQRLWMIRQGEERQKAGSQKTQDAKAAMDAVSPQTLGGMSRMPNAEGIVMRFKANGFERGKRTGEGADLTMPSSMPKVAGVLG